MRLFGIAEGTFFQETSCLCVLSTHRSPHGERLAGGPRVLRNDAFSLKSATIVFELIVLEIAWLARAYRAHAVAVRVFCTRESIITWALFAEIAFATQASIRRLGRFFFLLGTSRRNPSEREQRKTTNGGSESK
jgi:hypothetical protein